ncbi:TPA: hypothetical protein ACKQG3_005718 [Pseudomonas aeruginosa]
MSSTQLIEQCATRLRGIVEALDNIHDTSPHRWSTDLDDVHSSAESLLALIKDQAPARSEASFEEWLANELEGEDGQPVPAAVCDIALARRAFNHWPKLEHPAKVCGVRFSAGVSSRLVVEAAQRLNEFESTPEQEAERPEVVAYRTIGRHTKHQHPHYALNYYKQNAEDQAAHWRERGCEVSEDELMTVAQHERIVGALRFERQQTDRAFTACINERDAALARVAELETKLAELERQEPVAFVQSLPVRGHQPCKPKSDRENGYTLPLYAAPVAQAQHSVPDGAADLCRFLAKLYCELDGLRYSTAKLPAEQIADALIFKWPVLQGARNQLNIKRISEQPYDESKLHSAIAAMLAAAPGKEAPQAWIDVQAERRRQIEAEGWTPEHDDAHSHGQMARAAACYALAGSSAPNDGTAALLVSLAWPWDEQWWKPSTARRDMVKACALGLAEIERLDRAAASQGGPSDA